MKAKLNQIQVGLSKWYMKVIAPMGGVKTIFVAPIFDLAVYTVLKKNSGTVRLITDENGEIDIEFLYKEYTKTIQEMGSVEVMGIKFNNQDLDELYEAIKAEIPAENKKEKKDA